MTRGRRYNQLHASLHMTVPSRFPIRRRGERNRPKGGNYAKGQAVPVAKSFPARLPSSSQVVKSFSAGLPSTSWVVTSFSAGLPSTSWVVKSFSARLPSTSWVVKSFSAGLPSSSWVVESSSARLPSSSRGEPYEAASGSRYSSSTAMAQPTEASSTRPPPSLSKSSQRPASFRRWTSTRRSRWETSTYSRRLGRCR